MPDGAAVPRGRCAPTRCAWAVSSRSRYRLPGRARGGRLLPGLPVALRRIATTRTSSRRAETTSANSRASSTGSARAAGSSTPSCSRAASPRPRPGLPMRSRRCMRWASRSACTPAARIRGGSRPCCRRSTGSASTSRRRRAAYAGVTGVADSGFSALASLDLVLASGSRARSAHHRAPGADAARCARTARARARRSWRRPLGAATVSARRAAPTKRSCPARRTEPRSSRHCLRCCACTCPRSRCVVEVGVRPIASVVFPLSLLA